MSITASKPTITRKELENVLDCLFNEELSSGSVVREFELTLAKLVGTKYALATHSLSSAYHLAFRALDIKSSDEVIIPSFFYGAPLSSLDLTGGKAVFVDTKQGTLTPAREEIEKGISDKTRALVIGHLLGFPADIEALEELSIPVIEDLSHTIGTQTDNDTPSGIKGTIAVASFSPTMLITTGNGGIIFTNNSRLYSTMKILRGANESDTIGYDYCMTDFQGAMGLAQMSKLKKFIARRREIARIFYDKLKSTPHKTPYNFNEEFAYQSFPIFFDASNDKVDRYWRSKLIAVTRPITKPLHLYQDYKKLDYPNSTRLAQKLYTLPLYPSLTKKEIEKITYNLARFI